MKKLLVLILAATVALPAAFASGLRLGFSAWDAGDFSKAADDHMLLGAELVGNFDISAPVSLELRVAGMGYADDEDVKINDRWYDCDTSVYVVPLEAGLALNVPVGLLTAYGSGGIGYYFFGIDVDAEHHEHHKWHEHFSDDDDDSSFGAYATAGLRISLAPSISLYGQAEYRWIFDDISLFEKHASALDRPFTDLDPSGLGFSAGISINF